MCRAKRRVYLQRPGKIIQSGSQLPFPDMNNGSVVVSPAVVRLKPYGSVKISQRLVNLSPCMKRQAAVYVNAALIRLQPGGPVIIANGLVELTLCSQQQTPVDTCHAVIRINCQRRIECGKGFFG